MKLDSFTVRTVALIFGVPVVAGAIIAALAILVNRWP
jgi:hypothetical protein